MYAELTEQDRIDELERQIRLNQKSENKIISCPWCGQLSQVTDSTDDACCNALIEAIEKRGIRQLQSVVNQQKDFAKGIRSSIECPYCGSHNYKPKKDPNDWRRPRVSPFCCSLFDAAFAAIEYQLQEQAKLDHKRRIEDAYIKALKN